MADFVLIHGTTQSPAGWSPLAAALGRHGHVAHAVDLPTDQPDLTPEAYGKIIRRQVTGAVRPVVVAHSASGILLPAAARTLDARDQVWLAAWVPSAEASLDEEVRRNPAAIFNSDWLGKDPTHDPAVATEFLFHDCDPQTLEWALGTLRLFLPRAAYQTRVALADGIASTSIVASADRTIRPEWQRTAARERLGIAPIEIAAGHCPHVSQPDSVAKILLSIRP
ncbi:MAG: alpha/beta hydrolase [Gaiellaceae bacterium]